MPVCARPVNTTGRATAQRAADGFTLLELLVAMTLVGLILALLLGGLRLGSRVWERSAAEVERRIQLQLVQDLLRRQLEQAKAGKGEEAAREPRPGLRGSADAMSFISSEPAQQLAGGLYLVSLQLEETSGNLVATWRDWPPHVQGVAEALAVSQRVLLRGVHRMVISYLGRESEDATSSWRNHWKKSESLPALIRIELEQRGAREDLWPIFLVAPRIDDAG